jgi:hypothetical protein
MSHMVRTARKTRAMVFIPGKGAFTGAVDVYRDGAKVVVVGEGSAVHQSPHGPIAMSGRFAVKFPTVQAFDWAKRKAFEKNPEKYVKLVGILGVDDDANHAPALPAVVFDGQDPTTTPALLPQVVPPMATHPTEEAPPPWVARLLAAAEAADAEVGVERAGTPTPSGPASASTTAVHSISHLIVGG